MLWSQKFVWKLCIWYKRKNRTPQKPTKQKPHTKQIPQANQKNAILTPEELVWGKLGFCLITFPNTLRQWSFLKFQHTCQTKKIFDWNKDMGNTESSSVSKKQSEVQEFCKMCWLWMVETSHQSRNSRVTTTGKTLIGVGPTFRTQQSPLNHFKC